MATPQSRIETITTGAAIGQSPTRAVAGLRGARWKWGMGLLMTFVIYGAFFIAGGANGFGANGDTARIVFFHVPVAVLSFICYVVATVYALQHLRRSDLGSDLKSATAMEIGLLFCVGGFLFGLAIYVQLKNLPVHRAMREISELIYETCKTYLLTQGRFLLLLEAFIAVVIVLYFGMLLHYEAFRVIIILAFSLLGIASFPQSEAMNR